MPAHNAGPYTLTIPNAGTDSPALSAQLSLGQMKLILGTCIGFDVVAPATLTGTATLQVVPTEGSSSWVTQQQAGSDISFAVSKATPVNVSAFRDLRIHSSASEGGARDFLINFQLSAGI